MADRGALGRPNHLDGGGLGCLRGLWDRGPHLNGGRRPLEPLSPRSLLPASSSPTSSNDVRRRCCATDDGRPTGRREVTIGDRGDDQHACTVTSTRGFVVTSVTVSGRLTAGRLHHVPFATNATRTGRSDSASNGRATSPHERPARHPSNDHERRDLTESSPRSKPRVDVSNLPDRETVARGSSAECAARMSDVVENGAKRPRGEGFVSSRDGLER